MCNTLWQQVFDGERVWHTHIDLTSTTPAPATATTTAITCS
jgi:hypothetical protein